MIKKLGLLCLFLMVAVAARAAGPDPLHFIGMESDSLSPSSVDPLVGTAAWSTVQKTDGAASLHLVNATAGDWGFGTYVIPAVAQDVSGYEFVALDIYGDGSNRHLYLDFVNGGNQVYWNLLIDFTGWKHIVLEKAMGAVGSGSAAAVWAGVTAVVLYNNGPSAGADIYIDNITATNTAPVLVDNSVRLEATRLRPIVVDGDISDWDLTAAQPTYIDNALLPTHSFAANIRYSWDADYLYILIQEAGTCKYKTEPIDAASYAGGPWSFDGLALWIDLKHSDGGIFSVNPWFAFSSTGMANAWIARVNNDGGGLVTTPLAGGACATSGTFADGNRTIEAKLKWTSIASSVGSSYQPFGGILNKVKKAGWIIGSQPLIVEKDWNGQDVIGGGQWTTPSGLTANSRSIVLSNTVPVELSAFEIE